MKKIIFALVFIFSVSILQAETLEEFKKRIEYVGEYWNTNNALRPITKEIKDYWTVNVDKAKKYYEKCGVIEHGYVTVPYGSKDWNICAEIFAVSSNRTIEAADAALKNNAENAVKFKEKQAYIKTLETVGIYWNTNSALRPMTKEIKDYWWNFKPGIIMDAKAYLRECLGKFDTGFEYFVVKDGSKEWNRCIEIWAASKDKDTFEADKLIREQTKKANKIIKDYWAKVKKAGEYWNNNSKLRPVTKEIKDYWFSDEMGNYTKAKTYLEKCKGKVEMLEFYFVVPVGSKEWNRCIEILAAGRNMYGNDVFKLDKEMRENTKQIKNQFKEIQKEMQ